MSKCYLVPNFNFELQSEERKAAFLENYKAIFRIIPTGEKFSIIIVTNAVSINGENVTVSKAYIRVPDSLAVISEKLHSFTGKVVPEITDDDMAKILYPKTAFREYAVGDKWETPHIDIPWLSIWSICQVANTVAIINFEPVVSRKGVRSYRATLEISASGDTPEEAENTLKKACNFFEWKGLLLRKNGEKPKTPLLKRLFYSKTLSEENCAEFFPFLPEECIENNGFHYGNNIVTGNPIVYNRLDSIRIPHRCIVGGAGTGKSFLARDEIRQIFESTSDDVIIFSQCGEYGKSFSYNLYGVPENAINAVFLSASEDSYHINPMDVVIAEYNFVSNVSETERILQELTEDKGELVITIFEVLVKRELTCPEKFVIHNATNAVFRPFIEKLMQTKTACSFENNPTITDVVDYIRNNIGASGKGMNFADCSELLTAIYKNADCFRCFGYKTNIPADRMVHICYMDIPNRFCYIANIACVTYACNRMLMNWRKENHIWMYWEDIGHLFFYDENKAIADRFKSMITKSRTHGTAQTILVHSLSDVAKSFPFHNIEIYTLLRQSLTETKIVQELFKLSKEEIRHLINSGAGEGLFCIGQSTIPFKHYVELKKKEQAK